MICIDYTVVPPVFSLTPLATYTTKDAAGTANTMARNDAIIEKVQTHPTRYALIQSKISWGSGMQCSLALADGQFWSSDASLVGGGQIDDQDDDEEGLGEYKGTALDEVDMMMGRMALNGFLKSLGQEPAF